MKNAPNVKNCLKTYLLRLLFLPGLMRGAMRKAGKRDWVSKSPETQYLLFIWGQNNWKSWITCELSTIVRRAARVYLAGEIQPMKINDIGVKLARAGVQDAKLFQGHSGSRTGGLARLSQADQRRFQLRDRAVCMPSGGSINLIQKG